MNELVLFDLETDVMLGNRVITSAVAYLQKTGDLVVLANPDYFPRTMESIEVERRLTPVHFADSDKIKAFFLKALEQGYVLGGWNNVSFDNCVIDGTPFPDYNPMAKPVYSFPQKGHNTIDYMLEYYAKGCKLSAMAIKEGIGFKTNDGAHVTGLYDANALIYNANDVLLLKKLEEKKGYYAARKKVCELFGATWGAGKTDMLRAGLMVPKSAVCINISDKKMYQKAGVNCFGGFQKTLDGRFRNVIALDVAALYPSIIAAYGLELVCNKNEKVYDLPGIKVVSGKSDATAPAYILDNRGLTLSTSAKRYVELISEKNEAKKRGEKTTEKAIKLLLNSITGLNGATGVWVGNCFRDPRVYTSITNAGQLFMQLFTDEMTKKGGTLVYGKTDSGYYSFETMPDVAALVDFCLKRAKERLEELTPGVDTSFLEMKLEGVYDTFYCKSGAYAAFGENGTCVCANGVYSLAADAGFFDGFEKMIKTGENPSCEWLERYIPTRRVRGVRQFSGKTRFGIPIYNEKINENFSPKHTFADIYEAITGKEPDVEDPNGLVGLKSAITPDTGVCDVVPTDFIREKNPRVVGKRLHGLGYLIFVTINGQIKAFLTSEKAKQRKKLAALKKEGYAIEGGTDNYSPII